MKQYIDQPKELIILTEHFAPSTGATAQLITDLASDLHSMGIRLRILTSTAGFTDFPFPVHRFTGSGGTSVAVFEKIINGLIFFWGSALWLFTNIHKNQSLFIVSNPPFIGLIGLGLLFLKRTRYIFLLQDVFPRSASLTGILPAQGPIIFFWRSLLKAVLSKSRTTVVLSEAMLGRCKLEFGSDIQLDFIPNWAVLPPHNKSKSESILTHEWGVQNTFTVQYSGNFGRLHEILIILEAARILKDQPVKFLFVGAGAKADQIRKYCEAYKLTNILIKPYQPRALLADSIAACDLSIVSLIAGAEDTVAPSKFYGIIASSRPVLLVSSENSELASIISAYQCGLVIPRGDVKLLAETICYLKDNKSVITSMGANSRKLYQEKFGRSRSASEYYQMFLDYDMI